MKQNKALIVAGEASGDFYGAHLIKAFQEIELAVDWKAYGGSQMKDAGAELVYPLVDNAVIGVSEVIRNLPRYMGIYSGIKTYLKNERPSPVILIDYGTFNMKVAAYAKSIGLKTIYYIPPKVWIWNKQRAKTLARICDLIVAIFPFEPPLFRKFNGNAIYEGHPLVDSIAFKETGSMIKPSNLIALLPGSRPQEIDKMLPLFLDAAALILKEIPDIRFEIPRASSVNIETLGKIIDNHPPLPVSISDKPLSLVVKNAAVALSTSGTATLEVAMTGVPQVIAYEVSRFSAFVFHTFVKAPFVGLPNIIAGKSIVPELLQENCTSEKMAYEVIELITNKEKRIDQLENLKAVRATLGDTGSTQRIARAMTGFFS